MYFDSVRNAVPGPAGAQRGMRGQRRPGGRVPSAGPARGSRGTAGAAPAPQSGTRVGLRVRDRRQCCRGGGRGGRRIRDVCKAGHFNPSRWNVQSLFYCTIIGNNNSGLLIVCFRWKGPSSGHIGLKEFYPSTQFSGWQETVLGLGDICYYMCLQRTKERIRQ